jgi:hypothetical protein
VVNKGPDQVPVSLSSQSPPPTTNPSPQQFAPPASQPKISDRVGQPPTPPQAANFGTGNGILGVLPASSVPAASRPQAVAAIDTAPRAQSDTVQPANSPGSGPVAPVAQRVVLYEEDPAEPQGKQYVGSVIWRTEPIKASGNQKADVAMRADIEIPDRKFKMTISFRRNTDASLPASHTAELTFILPPDFSGGGVGNVPGILMKSNEQARGTPLAGLAVKVTDGFFLVGLSNVDADRARNLQLLKELRGSTCGWSTPTSAAPSSRLRRARRENARWRTH